MVESLSLASPSFPWYATPLKVDVTRESTVASERSQRLFLGGATGLLPPSLSDQTESSPPPGSYSQSLMTCSRLGLLTGRITSHAAFRSCLIGRRECRTWPNGWWALPPLLAAVLTNGGAERPPTLIEYAAAPRSQMMCAY